MCNRPIKIKNNSLEFDGAIDKSYFIVPCGHCSECMASKRADYEFRLLCEYKYHAKMTFFYTLTFDDDHLPTYEFPFMKNEPVKCFDKKLVQKFLKRLRKRLTKQGINLKYFISSEYGENTRRPHHHAIFFVDTYINPVEFRELISKTWIFGFNKPGRNNGVVTDSRPLSYCAKYVAKDLDFYDNFPSLDQLHRFYDNHPFRTKDGQLWRVDIDDDDIKNSMPFHLQSSNLGVKVLDLFTEDNLINNSYDFIHYDGTVKSYRIPLYYLRKKLYDTGININGNVQYKLNEFGEYIFKKKTLNRCLKTYDELKDIISRIETFDFSKDAFLSTYSPATLINMFKSFDNDFIDFFAKYISFYNGCENLALDFNNLSSDFDTFFQRKHMGKDEFACQVDWFSKEWDTLALSELIVIYYRIKSLISYEKYTKQQHSEQIFKRTYYKEHYINETEKEVSYRSFHSIKFI